MVKAEDKSKVAYEALAALHDSGCDGSAAAEESRDEVLKHFADEYPEAVYALGCCPTIEVCEIESIIADIEQKGAGGVLELLHSALERTESRQRLIGSVFATAMRDLESAAMIAASDESSQAYRHAIEILRSHIP